MLGSFQPHLQQQLDGIRAAGTYKRERVILTPQGTTIRVADGKPVLNLCANNYLGLAQHPDVKAAAHAALDQWGYGCASVRFICGTQGVHQELERALSKFLGTEDTILYGSCFDANGGLFETLLGPEDAVISDELNHASIIDGVRLCKAMRYRYANNDMADLEQQLQMARKDGARHIIIVTDGVFSMDGIVADLKGVCDLADKYEALVMVDECHAAGFIGKTGRGSVEACGVTGRVDIITGTLGKALGGAMGGYTTGRKEIIEMLRQRSRPYLFSNSLTPAIVGASIAVIDLLVKSTELRDKLEANVARFKTGIEALGFKTRGDSSAIVPVMLGDAKLSQVMADKLLDEGIYVIGFFFPVVPKDTARIRVQLSAAHSDVHIDKALAAFGKVGKELEVI